MQEFARIERAPIGITYTGRTEADSNGVYSLYSSESDYYLHIVPKGSLNGSWWRVMDVRPQ